MLNRQILVVVLVVALLAGTIGPFAAISFYVGSSPSTAEDITASLGPILQDPIHDCFTDQYGYVHCRS